MNDVSEPLTIRTWADVRAEMARARVGVGDLSRRLTMTRQDLSLHLRSDEVSRPSDAFVERLVEAIKAEAAEVAAG